MPLKNSVCIVGEFPPPPGGMAIQAELLRESLRDHLPVSAVDTNAGKKGPTIWKFLSLNVRLLFALPSVRNVHVFSHSYLSFFLFTLPPVMIGKILGCRVIINYHGGSADAFLSSSPAAKAVMGMADEVVVPSGFLKDVFAKHDIACRIVPNICNVDRFQFRVRSNPRAAFIVARHLEPVYNVALAIRAFAAVQAKKPDASLTIAGAGSEEKMLKDLAASLGVSNVRFLGNVGNDQMPSVYQEADVFLNASNIDNLPVAILEAFACGLPVVSTRAGGIPYILTDGETGLLADVGDAAGLAKAALRFLDEAGLAEKISKQAHATLAQYDRAAVANQWAELYK